MRPRRAPSRALGGLVLGMMFVAGAVIGIAGFSLWSRGDPHVRVTTDMTPILDRLALTAAQRQQADSILRASTPRTEAVMRELAGRMRSVSDSIDADLRTVLTPPQQRQLEALRRKPVFLLRRETRSGAVVVDTVRAAPVERGQP